MRILGKVLQLAGKSAKTSGMPKALSSVEAAVVTSKPAALSGLHLEHQVARIPAGRMAAPRPGFSETTEAYVNLIKNNRQELQCLVKKHQHNPNFSNDDYVREFMKFLEKKMNMPGMFEIVATGKKGIAGSMNMVDGILKYNTQNMGRLSELSATLMHETHHFMQQKEFFATMSIKEFSWMRAKAIEAALRRDYPCSNNEFMTRVSQTAKEFVAQYKAAGWEEFMKCYPKNAKGTPEYIRGMKLAEARADVRYAEGGEHYFNNLLEKEAFDISVRTQWEFEHSIVGEITASEKHIANEIYSTLTSETFSEVPRAQELVHEINVTPQNLIDVIRQAASRGISNPDNIIEMIF